MSQKVLWAPWRMEFIAGAAKHPPGSCVFCELPRLTNDRDNLILARGRSAFVILNRYPYNNGHLMIVPTRHTADWESLTAEEGLELHTLSQRAVRALRGAYSADGYNLGTNLGLAAGAGIKDHLHLHVVPRWIGDTNFLPVLAETKAMPQHLMTCYDTIAEHWRPGDK